MKKKKLVLLAVLASGLVLGSCGESLESSTDEDSSEATSSLTSSSVSEGTSSSSEESSSSSSHLEESSSSTSEVIEGPSSSSSEAEGETSSGSSLESSSSSEALQEVAIHVEAPEGITVDAPASAVPGTIVHFTADGDVASVTVDGVACGEDENGYYFLMPEEEATIVVTAKEPEATTYDLSAVGNITLVGAKESYEEGEQVSFSVATEPGIVLNSVSIARDSSFNAEPIDYTTRTENSTTLYEFTMPAYDVKVVGSTSYGLYSLTWGEADNDYILNVRTRPVGDEFFNVMLGNYVPYMAEVEVTLTGTVQARATGIELLETGEAILAEEGSNTLVFTMPHRSLTMKAIVEEYLRQVNIVDSDHISLSTYALVEGEYVATSSFVADSTVYVKVESSSEDYAVSDVVLSYTDNYERSDSIAEDGMNEDGYYHFTMPSTADEVTITVIEKNLVAFASAPFLGDYLGFELWDNGFGSAQVDELSAGWGFSLDGSGEFEYRNSNYRISNYDAETGIATGEEYEDFTFVYGGKVIFSHYLLRQLGGSDCVFMVQKQEGDSDDLYSVKANFVLDRYMMVQFFRDGQDYASAYYDVEENKYYFDVDFAFVGATSVLDYKDGDQIVVSYQGVELVNLIATDGSFIAPDAVMGTYTLAADESQILILDGAGHATYLGKEGLSYTIVDDTHIVMKDRGDVYNITLTDGHYVVDSYVPAPNDFAGCYYEGSYYDYEFQGTYDLTLEFVDATKCYFTLAYNDYNYFGGEECGEKNVENQTYAINEAEGTVTINTYSNSGSAVSFELSYNEDKTILTFVGDINFYYPTTGAELTLQ